MALQLLSNFGKQGVDVGLDVLKADIIDTAASSKYFNITEFSSIFTAGKTPVAFNGSSLLKPSSQIAVECLDSGGNSLFLEQAHSTTSGFSDTSKHVITVNVFNETLNGPGSLIFAGTSSLGEIVKWTGNITIDKTLQNASKVRFYKKPTMDVRPLLYPVIDTEKAQTVIPVIVPATGSVVLSGVVSSIHVTNGGSGYVAGSTHVSIGRPSSGGTQATAVAVISGGSVNTISITNKGQGYFSVPSVTITGGDGLATAVASISDTVSGITITNGGKGYSINPTVVFTNNGGGGTGAAATATITNGRVTTAGITITDPGSGYTPPAPKVTFPQLAPPLVPGALTLPIVFTSSFYTVAANPVRNTDQSFVDPKLTDIDYRLILTGLPPAALSSSVSPTGSFNSQMEGQEITLYIDQVQAPFSFASVSASITTSFTIEKVLDAQTAMLDNAFYYPQGSKQLIANIPQGTCSVSYSFTQYNTNPESQQIITIASGLTTIVEGVYQSYVEVTYNNINPFSGYIARHKLYRKSSYVPGDFQLISDEPVAPLELLADPISYNQFYRQIGTFYNQLHVDRYWKPNNPNNVTVNATVFPINSMEIVSNSGNPTDFDGTQYVMVNNYASGSPGTGQYVPYDPTAFNNFSGSSYCSNFINLKPNALYLLSTNLIMEKSASDGSANISFYFTSSLPDLTDEPNFTSNYGLLLGQIITQKPLATTEYFNGTQQMFFTPLNEYFGTLVVVPYHCNVTLSDVSLKVYGDSGFSPDILFIRIPFPLDAANETFQLKAELFDINHTLVYSGLTDTQVFDPEGNSLYSNIPGSVANIISAISVTPATPATPTTPGKRSKVQILGDTSLSDLASAVPPYFLVSWDINQQLGYTPISDISIIGDNEYINVTTVTAIGRSIDVQYTGSSAPGGPLGRQIFVDLSGNKTTNP